MKIQSKEIKLAPIETIIVNPKNANKHSPEQIERLIKIIKYQGFREPLIISNRSGFLVCGHGRLEASKQMGIIEVPVIYQDFENEAQEYAHMISDNEIARWAKLDQVALKEDYKQYELSDLELLGLEDMSFLDAVVVETPKEKEEEESCKAEQEQDFLLVIKCKDELDRQDLYEELTIRELQVEQLTKKSEINKVKKLIKKQNKVSE